MKIRDKEAFLLFVAGLSLSFFIVINGAHLVNAWFTQLLKSQDESGYRNSILLEVTPEQREESWGTTEDIVRDYQLQLEKASEFLELLTAQEVTAYIKGLFLPVGAAAEEMKVDVILSGREEWYRTLQSGRYPYASEWQKTGKLAVISRAAEKYVEVIDGQRMIKIGGENYQVMGVFENYQVSEGNIEISIYYVPTQKDDILHQKLAYAFQSGYGRWICFGSNAGDVAEAAKAFMTELEAAGGYSVSVSEYNYDEANFIIEQFYARIKGVVLFVLFLVSLINCREITELWITRKKVDLVILKTFGMNNRQIILRVLAELVQMLVVSLVAVVCFDGVYRLFSRTYMEPGSLLRSFLLLMGAFLIVIGASMIPIVQQVCRCVPAQGLRGE